MLDGLIIVDDGALRLSTLGVELVFILFSNNFAGERNV
jgi:hypothetical protein